jgi:hypothetical protein
MSEGTQVDAIPLGSPRPSPPLRPGFFTKRANPGGASFSGLQSRGASFPCKRLSALEARRCLRSCFRLLVKALPGLEVCESGRREAIETVRMFSREAILNRVKRGEKLCHK